MANVKNQNKKPSPRHKAVAANICPAKPLAKAPFPSKSLFLASIVAGTRPRPWSGLCQVGSAELLPQQLQRAKYFITIFSSHMGHPRRSRWDCVANQPVSPAVGSRGVLSLVSYRSKAYATRWASLHLAARLLCFPRSSPINILNLQSNFRAALKRGRGLKSY